MCCFRHHSKSLGEPNSKSSTLPGPWPTSDSRASKVRKCAATAWQAFFDQITRVRSTPPRIRPKCPIYGMFTPRCADGNHQPFPASVNCHLFLIDHVGKMWIHTKMLYVNAALCAVVDTVGAFSATNPLDWTTSNLTSCPQKYATTILSSTNKHALHNHVYLVPLYKSLNIWPTNNIHLLGP